MNTKKLHMFEYDCLTYFLIRSSFIGICLNNLLLVSKQDNWISLILAFILGFIPIYIFYLIINNNEKENIVDLINKTCGKIMGIVINLIISLSVFIFISLLFWNLVNFISSQYLYKTPNLAIIATFAFALYYITSKKNNVLARVSVILFYISIFLNLFSIIGLAFQVNLDNLQPTFEYGITPIFEGAFQYIAYNILPLFLITIIPKDSISNNKKYIKNSILVYTLTTLLLFIVCFLLISIYGIELAQILQYPAFHLLKRLSIFGFIQRVESILSIQWIFDIFIAIAFGINFINITLKQTFNLKKHKISCLILTLGLVFSTNFMFPNNTIGNNIILKVFPFFIYIFFLIIPTIIYIVNKIKNVN